MTTDLESATSSRTERPQRTPVTLFIVESPIKARTIAGFLGDDYLVRSTKGHFADIPTRAGAVDIDAGFTVSYELRDQGRAVIDALSADLQQCDRLVLATDADREGELIAHLLMEFLQPEVPVLRVTYHAVTEEAVREALAHPRQIDVDLVAAARTRRVLDRLFGYEVTDVMRRKVRHNTTAGRVQSPALRLIVERELERRSFRPATYFDVEVALSLAVPTKARLRSVDGSPLAVGSSFDAEGRPNSNVLVLDEDAARAVADGLLTGATSLEVAHVDRSSRSIKPPAPFILSTMVQEGANRLGLRSKEIESISNDLFNRGHITYVRTDNPVHYPSSRTEIRDRITELLGAEWLNGSERFTTAGRKSVQGAHEAIRPTDLNVSVPPGLSRRHIDVYELIWRRTLASQMIDARRVTTTVTLRAEIEGRSCEFSVSGSVYVEPGFLRVLPSAHEDVVLPDLQVGDLLSVTSAEVKAHRTTPPPRFTEASLVKTLEELGIGRPSTYVAIIEKLRAGYIWSRRGDRALIPTLTAFAAHGVLNGHFAELIGNDFTSDVEKQLDQVSTGSVTSEEVLRDFYFGTRSDGPGLRNLIECCNADVDPREVNALVIGRHPETGDDIVVRAGKSDAAGPRPYLKFNDRNVPLSDRTDIDDLRLETVLDLVSLPRTLGPDPVTGQDITVSIGRWGPYVDRAGQRASVARIGLVSSLTVDDAHDLIEEKLRRDAERAARGRRPAGATAGKSRDATGE